MVEWTLPARDDLKAVHDYIDKDSDVYAMRVVERAVEKSEILNEFPETGRIVPEIGDKTIREMFVYSYRMIYEIRGSDVFILSFVHGARNLKAEEIVKSKK